MDPKSAGQSAMEYLMSYGWAVLVVVIVAGAMWQLGVFNFGGSPPVATGFSDLKPMTATCELKDPLPWTSNYAGFECTFTNTADQNIVLRDINLTIDGNRCYYMKIGETLGFSGNNYWRWCSALGMDHGFWWCYANDLRSCNGCIGGDPANGLPLGAGSGFIVSTMSGKTFREAEPCTSFISDVGTHEVFVDISYDMDVGGVIISKHSAGTIRLQTP